MKTTRILRILASAAILLAVSAAARAETLSWNAVITYTDGSAITSPVTYTAIWSQTPGLGSPTTLASSISSASTNFSVETAGIPRGTTVYFAIKSKVNGVESAFSAPFAWNVPAQPDSPRKHPSSPKRFRIK
jgi:hypothetical protein